MRQTNNNVLTCSLTDGFILYRLAIFVNHYFSGSTNCGLYHGRYGSAITGTDNNYHFYPQISYAL